MPHRPPFRRVTSRQNSVVAAFRDAAAHPSDELVFIEGARLALEAVQAGWTLDIVAFGEAAPRHAAAAALLQDLPEGTDLLTVTHPVLDAISPASSPSGVAALARPPKARRNPFGGAAPLVIAACDVQDPGNIGAILRAAEAAGAGGALVCGTSAHPFGWKALRGSMGSAFRLPIAMYGSAAAAVEAVRSAGLRVVALAVRGGEDLSQADLQGGVAIFVGGEGPGLARDVLAAADRTLSIPMAPPVESLNVAVAAGIALYEAWRQRR